MFVVVSLFLLLLFVWLNGLFVFVFTIVFVDLMFVVRFLYGGL